MLYPCRMTISMLDLTYSPWPAPLRDCLSMSSDLALPVGNPGDVAGLCSCDLDVDAPFPFWWLCGAGLVSVALVGHTSMHLTGSGLCEMLRDPPVDGG
jgi:hypothetical protein